MIVRHDCLSPNNIYLCKISEYRMSTILGIANPVHNTGAALIQDGEILAAVNESSLSRVKRESRFPTAAINYILSEYDEKPNMIALSGIDFPNKNRKIKRDIQRNNKLRNTVDTISRFMYDLISGEDRNKTKKELYDHIAEGRVPEMLADLPMNYVDHHKSHAASTYYTSGFESSTIITVDGAGDGLSSTIYNGENGEMNQIHSNWDYNSIGLLWTYIPSVFGFKGPRHAGKFTGLASYVDNVPKELTNKINSLISANGMEINNTFFQTHAPFGETENVVSSLRNQFEEYDAAEVAFALQRRTNEVIEEVVKEAVNKTGNKNIAVAGGVFANVKLNQHLYNLDCVDKLFVHPDMRDSGLAVGAALDLEAHESNGITPERIKQVYLGPKYTTDDTKNAIQRADLSDNYSVENNENIGDTADIAADLLANGSVVIVYQGAVEYGPRALGNRSILYQPTDANSIRWLNQNLDRTTFMPFAPVTLQSHATECYEGYDAEACPAADFMTVTFDCSDIMKERSPGAVHIDGTARPQILKKNTNRLYYKILEKYHELTSIPTLINTSFNMHGDPIVSTPSEAINTFKQINADALVLNTTIIKEE